MSRRYFFNVSRLAGLWQFFEWLLQRRLDQEQFSSDRKEVIKDCSTFGKLTIGDEVIFIIKVPQSMSDACDHTVIFRERDLIFMIPFYYSALVL